MVTVMMFMMMVVVVVMMMMMMMIVFSYFLFFLFLTLMLCTGQRHITISFGLRMVRNKKTMRTQQSYQPPVICPHRTDITCTYKKGYEEWFLGCHK